MKRRNLAFDSDRAEGALEVVALAYASAPSYDAGWEQIHPEDQAEWLASFKAVHHQLDQLVAWNAEELLEPEQREQLDGLLRQRGLVEAVLERRGAVQSPPAPPQTRAAAFLSLVLDD